MAIRILVAGGSFAGGAFLGGIFLGLPGAIIFGIVGFLLSLILSQNDL